MTDLKPEFVFTIPPVACLFGEAENIQQLFPPGWLAEREGWAEASLLVSADNAARAIAGRDARQSLTCDAGTREHQEARAALHAFLMSTSPGVIEAALWKAVEHHQRQAFASHWRQVGQIAPWETAPTLIFGWGNPSRGDDALGADHTQDVKRIRRTLAGGTSADAAADAAKKK